MVEVPLDIAIYSSLATIYINLVIVVIWLRLAWVWVRMLKVALCYLIYVARVVQNFVCVGETLYENKTKKSIAFPNLLWTLYHGKKFVTSLP